MRGNRVRSFVTRSGRVIRARVEEVRHRPPRQGPANGERRAYARGGQHHPAGGAAIGNRVDMPRLAAFVVIGIICIFVITLAVAGIYGAGKWAFSGKKDRAVEVRVESNRRDMETASFQKPVSRRPLSYTNARSSVNEENHNKPTHEWVQPKGELETPGRRRQTQEIPAISREPVVDYLSSVKEMKDVLETRSTEIRRITEDLRNIGRSDESDR